MIMHQTYHQGGRISPIMHVEVYKKVLPILSFSLFIFFGLLHPSWVWAEQADTSSFRPQQTVMRILIDNGYTEEESSVIAETLGYAGSIGIPEELLVPRVREGVAKRVSVPRLERALSNDIENLRAARSLFEQFSNAEEFIGEAARWKRAANMLATGMDPQELYTLVEACSTKPNDFRSASVLYVSLFEWGLTEDSAKRVVESLVLSEIHKSEYEGVIELFRVARRQRLRPEELVERIVSAAPHSRSIDELSNKILR